ncbi:ABC-three component system middle component 4 [Paenibacillus sp. RC21]|uniref:ABC-three component system middle component 4 n=1 Tax=Paenibacillus sp. RC21 TaxID=3156312 RepID=UPI003836A55E
MTILPFIIPENEYNVRLARLLILIKELAYTKRGKLVMSLDRLAMYDHLLRNPVLLKGVLDAEGQGRLMELRYEERDSIESLYPNRASLYDSNSIKRITYSLFYLGYISARHDKEGRIYYFTTPSGDQFAEELESSYFNRTRTLSKVLVSLQKLSNAQLQKLIKSINYGVLF